MSNYTEPEYSPASERAYSQLPSILRQSDSEQLYPVEVPETEEVFNYAVNPSFEAYGPGVDIGRNFYPNPSFEAPDGPERDVAQNVVANPNGRQVSGTVDVRTNLAHSGNTVAASATTTLTPGVVFGGSTWTRLSQTVAATGEVHVRAERSQLIPDDRYVSSVELGNDGSSSVTVALQWCDGMTNQFTLPAKSRGRVHVRDNRAAYSDENRHMSLSLVDGSSILFRQVMIEAAGELLPYFDGDTWAGDTDFTPAWSGTVGRSISHLRAPAPVGWSADNGVVYFSARYNSAALFSPYDGPVTAYVDHSGGELDRPVTAIVRTPTDIPWAVGYEGAWPPPSPKLPEDSDVASLQYPVLSGGSAPPVGYPGAFWFTSSKILYRKAQ